jgi:hypothetical protein
VLFRSGCGQAGIVSGEHDGGAAARLEVLREPEDLGGGRRVQVAGGLVGANEGTVPAVRTLRAREQLRHALAPRVFAVLALCCLVFDGVQSAPTYLVPSSGGPRIVSGSAVAAFLLAFGVATTVGSLPVDASPISMPFRTLVGGTVGLTGLLSARWSRCAPRWASPPGGAS